MKRCRFVSYGAASTEGLSRLTRDYPPPQGWAQVHATARAAIFCATRAHAIALPNQRGTIIGEIYTREDRPRPIGNIDALPLSIRQKPSIGAIAGEIWGRYVAFLDDREGLLALRDPSGSLPCYFAAVDHGVIFASDARLLVTMIGRRAAIDWNIVAHHLVLGSLPTNRTAILGVDEVLPGFPARWTPEGVSRGVAWNPWDWAACTDTTETHECNRRLRSTIEQSVKALASSSRHALLTVSGGLDSSIVAACLAKHPLTLLTLATQRAEGDERSYARAVANHLDIELIEAFFEPETINLSISNARHLPRPLGYSYGQTVDLATRRVIAEQGCDAYFTGNGGDNVFCYLTSASPVVDRWITFGWDPGLKSTIHDVRALTGASLQAVVIKAIKRRLVRAKYPWPRDHRFLVPSLAQSVTANHPWLSAPRGALPGKAAHIAGLLRAQLSLENAPEDVSLLTPLLSQPVLETCLATPTWHWCAGGINRAPARSAFRDALPPLVIDRTTKTGPGSFMADVFEKNRAEIRDRLYHGTLMRHHLLDLPQLERLFSPGAALRGEDFRRALTLVDAEAWIQSWD